MTTTSAALELEAETVRADLSATLEDLRSNMTRAALAGGAAALAKEAFQTGRTIRDLAREKTSLSESDLTRILDPAAMVEPGRSFASAGG